MRAWLAGLALVAVAGCSARRLPLPSDPGTPFPDYSAVHATVTTACRGVRTLTAALSLRGRAGTDRLRGRLIAGFERPDSMRLEGLAPIGPPVFQLVSRAGEATLLLTREERLVSGERPEAILGALTGVSLGPADLQAILTGCAVPMPQPIGGRLHDGGWATIDLEGGSTVYLRRTGAWRVAAARRNGWQVDYLEWTGTFPQTVRLRSGDAGPGVEMTATLSEVEANTDLDPAAFRLQIPGGVRPLSLEELRAAGPLGETP